MSASRSSHRATGRDRRRRELGQNFLADRSLTERFVASLGVRPGELVVDVGAGTGSLTLPLVEAGAQVWAVEADPDWSHQLRRKLANRNAQRRVRVIEADFRSLRMPREPFRVVANPPFGLTTELLSMLLDRPDRGPVRADLILQQEVAVKYGRPTPSTLRGAAWAPWWEFRLGSEIPRRAFRPRPSVDAAVLTIIRRDPPVLPVWLAPRLRELVRPAWSNERRDDAPSRLDRRAPPLR